MYCVISMPHSAPLCLWRFCAKTWVFSTPHGACFRFGWPCLAAARCLASAGNRISPSIIRKHAATVPQLRGLRKSYCSHRRSILLGADCKRVHHPAPLQPLPFSWTLLIWNHSPAMLPSVLGRWCRDGTAGDAPFGYREMRHARDAISSPSLWQRHHGAAAGYTAACTP